MKYCDKVHPSLCESSEPPSPCFVNLKTIKSDSLAQYLEAYDCEFTMQPVTSKIITSFSTHPSPVSISQSACRCRSDEEDANDFGKHFLSPSTKYCQDVSNVDSHSLNGRHDFYSCKSVGSSPSVNPFRDNFTPYRVGISVQKKQEGSPMAQYVAHFYQENMDALRKPNIGTEELDNNYDYSDDFISHNHYEKSQKLLDFENNGLIWFPPPPEDENEEIEIREKQNEGIKEPLKAIIQGHFRVLVLQLLLSEGIKVGKEDNAGDWLDIITTIAWQAAKFVKPDTSRGGSMDPGDYVKVKCIASGNPSESTLVKGVVCTKNIKHKRMTSQYKNPRLLLLGGALEFQKVPNQLASFSTLLQQENDHLKMIIAKIEALHPNVLLVEKSVSSYAQEYLLEKEISLVLNVKRPLLERIARCSGALASCCQSCNEPTEAHVICYTHRQGNLTINVRRLSSLKLPGERDGKIWMWHRCLRCAHIDGVPPATHRVVMSDAAWGLSFGKFLELSFSNHATANRVATCGHSLQRDCLRFYVLLRGRSREELKKVKHVVQYAVFAAYHLSLETSFLADEGATLPKMKVKHSVIRPEKMQSDNVILVAPSSFYPSNFNAIGNSFTQNDASPSLNPKQGSLESFPNQDDQIHISPSFGGSILDTCNDDLTPIVDMDLCSLEQLSRLQMPTMFPCDIRDFPQSEKRETVTEEERHNMHELEKSKKIIEDEASSGCFSATDTHQSILVSFSSRCVLKGTVCERSRLFRIKFYGSFDKPLGRYLQDDLFDQFGNMIAFFRYTPIDILSVHLPLSMLEFSGDIQREWIRKEAAELMVKVEILYAEVLDVLDNIEQKNNSSNASDLSNHIMELRDQIQKERNDYISLLQPTAIETSHLDLTTMDILELNCLKRSLLIGLHVWDRRLNSLDSHLGKGSAFKGKPGLSKDGKLDAYQQKTYKSTDSLEPPKSDARLEQNSSLPTFESDVPEELDLALCIENKVENEETDKSVHSPTSTLSERIDSAWIGTDLLTLKVQSPEAYQGNELQTRLVKPTSKIDNLPLRKVASPMRVHSFDSVLRLQARIQKGLHPSTLHLSTLKSFHATRDYRTMVRDPVSNVTSTYSYTLPFEAQKLNLLLRSTPTLINCASHVAEGARLLLVQRVHSDIVIAVYDNDPASIISYALSSKEYEEWVDDKSIKMGGGWSIIDRSKKYSATSSFSPWQPFGSLDTDYTHFGSFGSEDTSSSIGAMFTDTKRSPHLIVSFGDDSYVGGGIVKFSVTCYFAKQFYSLRRKCCPNEVDFVRSLSRCQKWSAQGGKSNVYFAKSLDERFIIKQVQKTELESFNEFAPEYFKYLSDSLSSGSPTCLAKILGIYQVSVKHLKGGKETKMDLVVMENLFFRRSISRIYDLKGSARSRYNPDTSGRNKVLLDMNLLETLRTEPIFLGSKAKRILERAIWNDTSFLASIAVMDYPLLVGLDEEHNELVLGIIDFMRQYTWDKHLETWVKASGILGGPKNASPTIISPKQYKKRFRKAMTAYFLTVPDQWTL
ncbi:hypothetical protein GOBAR_AA20696 [Gossypium barbadense]|uniref:1-phosphatidylinositol-3-phosphate 5-kinase n=1 Tax=Gossypium barbadense TaxID=3634 RepID=A0A2P5X9G8_GOSBA|nr:hypothetical protein GOBAR_AA20696 [Gossypium barbadense]